MQLRQAIAKIQEIIKLKHKVSLITKAVYNAWNFNLDITIDDKKYLIKNLERSDLNSLLKFKDSLGDQSRKLFCPYPWENKTELKLCSSLRLTLNCTVLLNTKSSVVWLLLHEG